MSDGISLPAADDARAAELALGVLEGEEKAAAEAQLVADPAFAAAHDLWTARFMRLLGARDEAPPPSSWRRIEDRLPANDVSRTQRDGAALRWWRAGALAASAAAAILAVIVVGRAPDHGNVPVATRAVAPPLLAILTGADRAAVVTVSFDPASGRLVSAPARLEVGTRSAELWVIPPGASPRSLGVIGARRPSRRNPPAELARLLAPDATLALSLEPIGGSPTGAPTGPVILSGKIVAL